MVSASSFKGKSFISMRDYSREEIDFILKVSDEMMPLEKKGVDMAKGKVMGALFFEPSTRTRLSFESAMLRLGGGVTGFADPGVSSAKKGETMEDTIKTVENYVDVIAMRHPDEWSSRKAAKVASIPILNGGSGSWEHPTQAVLDMHCMKHAKGKLDGLTVGLCGDLLYGRTTHSLMIGLSKYDDVKLKLISPKQLAMREDVLTDTKGKVEWEATEDLTNVIGDLDVLYATRIQKERFPSEDEYKKFANAYIIDNKMMAKAKKGMVLMHPLPRVNEIAQEVDSHPGALYFKQVHHGIWARMAIISLALGIY
ncbi:aspartate carbamoyltransferase [Candidatus Bathyarchaeota archaeon]|nr:aspartate carbamoyltransferase [Candidatus Bathyarchaeota archaeon]